MPSLMPFPDAPFLSLLLLAVLLMIFMYFAREPMQHVFKTLAQAVSGGLYLVADWARDRKSVV